MSKGIKHIYEAFNFGSVNNQKAPLNVVNTVLTPILYKIHNFEKLSDDEYNILISYTGIYKVSDKDELEKIIEYFIERFGNECNLNWIDVKNVTNMQNLFCRLDFNGDISKWDVSNVTNMQSMFCYSKFDGDISNWDVSNVTNMKEMFDSAYFFEGDISKWDVSNVTDMSYMFSYSKFNGDISLWNVSNVRNMQYMFTDSNFGLSFMNIDEWDVSNVTNMCCMFARTDFNKDISDWDVSNVTDMSCMFAESNFNQNISNWSINPNCNTDEMFDTCAIEDRYMPKLPKKQTKVNESFEFTSVNNQKAHINIYDELPVIKERLDNFKELENYQYHILATIPSFYKVENISLLKKLIPYFIGQFGNDCNLNWIDTSNITDMYALFMSTEFNGDISKWDVSNVTIMSLMFANSKFNGDIRGWDVSKVSDMSSMFNMSKFNKDISKWDVSNVVNMRRMFYNAEFNGDISRWDVSNVITMEGMFAYSKFNGDITGWRPSVEDNVNMHNMFLSCDMKKTPLWYTEDRPVMEAFDFNSVADKKPSITANIKRISEDVIKNEVLPLFNNLRPDYVERSKFIPDYRFIGNKCELLYQNKVIIDFTFGLEYIDVMNIYDTTRLNVVNFNGYIQDISVLFYIVRLIPIPINSLNFCYDSSKYPAYKLEGSMGHDELIDLTRIMEDYTDKLPEHITFNSKYIDLYNLRFENENAIKKFIYKLRKDNGELKYEIKQCIFITETPPEFRGLIGTSRSKGTTSKLIRKYIKAPVNTLLEGFDFDSVNKGKQKLNIFEKIFKILETPVNKLSEDDKIFIKSMKDSMPPFKVNTKEELTTIISRAIKLFGTKCNLNWIDVSNITDMKWVFLNSNFNGDISLWNVSNVTNMLQMFLDSKFNGDISLWNVSNVTNMGSMFSNSEFNGDISLWNVSNVTKMNSMFSHSKFNSDISNWDVRNVKDMTFMFSDTEFNHDISNWNINNVTDKSYMFDKCKIKNIYKPKKKKKVEEGFDFDTINKEKKKINIYDRFHRIIELPYSKLTLEDKSFIKSFKDSMPTIKVKNRKELGTLLPKIIKILGNKCDLNWIDVSSITDMSYLFARKKFNGDISNWDVSNVTDMCCMFLRSHFSGDISKWNVSNVTEMDDMFYKSCFNGDISKWDVSNVTNMYKMFAESNFNSDISNWDVSNVTNMEFMFYSSPFNLDISQWKIKHHCSRVSMFGECPINNEYRPKIFQKRKKLEEGFDFGSIDKKKIIPSLSMKDKVLLFDNFLKDLYDKHVLTGMQYGNKYFSDAWSKAKTDLEFNGTYYKCEADGDHLNVELNYMNLYFQSPENYNQFCEDIKIFKDIRINGLLSIYMKTLSLRMQRLENFGELGKTITFVKELDINNLILHDFTGMPEVKSFKANNSTIFTFNGFKYKDAVKDIELYYKPGQHCVIDWTGFPKKLYGIFSYKLNVDLDSLAAYTMAFEKQLTTLKGFPEDFMYVTNPENAMYVGQPNFININMEKWQRDKIKLHIMDLLLQEFPNRQKRERIYKRLTKIYRYR